ncbi:MAG TPA: hypothetical protein VMT51_01005 [Dongiaceae bacterium]|nr:hypothetical protein [Dongiaceae bacterium]
MRALGIFWIAYGVFRAALGVALLVFAPTATVMFGALLTRVPEPYSLMSAFHVLYFFAILLSLVCAVVAVLGGFAAMGGGGRALLIAAALLAASELPLGVTLGAYTLACLAPLRPGTRA